MLVLEFTKNAKSQLDDLPARYRKQIKAAILSLIDNPMPSSVKKIKGAENIFRIRSGDYRVVYYFSPKKNLIFIIAVGKRNDDDVYRKFTRSIASSGYLTKKT